MNSIFITGEYNIKYWVIPNTKYHKLAYDGYGILHNENGPAIEDCYGSKWWYVNGLLHREDGPAVELEYHIIWWYLNGYKIEPTNEMMEKYIRLNPDNISKYYEYPLETQLLAISLKQDVIFNIKYPDPKLKELYPQLFALKNSGLI